ncbi:MAG: DNA topoisomerase IB, partial [Actinomycetota bacterium]
LAAVALAVSSRASGSPTARKRAVARAMKEVSEYLGNTPAVARASYVDPRLIDLFEDGVTIEPALRRLGEGASFGEPATHGAIERAVLTLLRS